MIPWKFHKDLFNTDFENLFWKVRKKYRFSKKSEKNSDKTAEEKLVFFTFSELLGPKEKREAETFPEIWKKVEITAPYWISCSWTQLQWRLCEIPPPPAERGRVYGTF